MCPSKPGKRRKGRCIGEKYVGVACFPPGLVLAQGCWTTVNRLGVARSHRLVLPGLAAAPAHFRVNFRQWEIRNLCDDNGFLRAAVGVRFKLT